ncbi:hypothetical protein C9I90_23750, partial [Photobacterium aphoticum]|uniref:hypothetical protein n=1 Tax=Photobacterium aphoticum TaxID=754436 RepID=UPI000D4E40C7
MADTSSLSGAGFTSASLTNTKDGSGFFTESSDFPASSMLALQLAQGTVYAPQSDGRVLVANVADTASSGQVLVALSDQRVIFADANAKYVLMVNGEPVLMDWPCPTCVLVAPSASEQAAFDAEALLVSELDAIPYDLQSGVLADVDLDALEALILAGGDPTELLEAPAAKISASKASKSTSASTPLCRS